MEELMVVYGIRCCLDLLFQFFRYLFTTVIPKRGIFIQRSGSWVALEGIAHLGREFGFIKIQRIKGTAVEKRGERLGSTSDLEEKIGLYGFDLGITHLALFLDVRNQFLDGAFIGLEP